MHQPPGVIGIELAGFFTPLTLYALELQRDFKRG
jgi:hypothetical protein